MPVETKLSQSYIEDFIPTRDFKAKSNGYIPRGLTSLAVIIIVSMLAIIMLNIFIGGIGKISWDFLSSPPEHGMEKGGIFPAIFGTVFLVITFRVAFILTLLVLVSIAVWAVVAMVGGMVSAGDPAAMFSEWWKAITGK